MTSLANVSGSFITKVSPAAVQAACSSSQEFIISYVFRRKMGSSLTSFRRLGCARIVYADISKLPVWLLLFVPFFLPSFSLDAVSPLLVSVLLLRKNCRQWIDSIKSWK